ncbi:MAG: ATP-binding protein [Chitinispirillaceae bacterium]|nr:ATP-binding protein [Chitinispirillaceae bacterium]
MNCLQAQNFFRLSFIELQANVIFLGNVGIGKPHLSCALAYQACLNGYIIKDNDIT